MERLTKAEMSWHFFRKKGAEICKKKRKFPSEEWALIEAKHFGKKYKGPGYDVYSCPYCKGWHLTKARNKK